MSFHSTGHEALPMEATYQVNSGVVVRSYVCPVGFASHDGKAGGASDGYFGYAESDFLKDALVEWPVAQHVRPVYIVKWRLCDDPTVREKIEKADQEIYWRNRDQFRIRQALTVKRSEKACVLSQLKTLEDEDKQLDRVLEKKEPIVNRESGLCSSEEELDELISSLHYRISNCSKAEERRLTCEIKRLEMTRGRVKASAAMRTWILEMSPEYATQGEVASEALEGVKKKHETTRENIEHHMKELKVVEGEITALENELADVIVKRDWAYTRIQDLRKQRDGKNDQYYRNRAVLRDARVLAASNDVVTLQELVKSKVEDFFARWNSDKSFRENYQRRIQPSLELRNLARDGRLKVSGYKHSAARESPANAGTKECTTVEAKEVVVANNRLTLDILSDHDNGSQNGENGSFAFPEPSDLVASPEAKSEIVDYLITGKNCDSRLVPNPEIISENGDGLAGEEPAFDSKRTLGSVKSPETVSENGYGITSGKNSSSESVPSTESAQKLSELISEDLCFISEENKEGDEAMLTLKEVARDDLSIISEETQEAEDAKLKLIEATGDDLAIISEEADNDNIDKLKPGEMGSDNPRILSEEGGDMMLKLKEMKREEEILKAKKAQERKKKLAEKNAAKAAIKAQKEAERKQKEQEKKAKKKAAAPMILPEQEQELEPEEKKAWVEERARDNTGTFARVAQGLYNRRAKFWRKNRAKGTDPVLKAILKRRRSANYWLWAVAVALILAVFTVVGYFFLLQQF